MFAQLLARNVCLLGNPLASPTSGGGSPGRCAKPGGIAQFTAGRQTQEGRQSGRAGRKRGGRAGSSERGGQKGGARPAGSREWGTPRIRRLGRARPRGGSWPRTGFRLGATWRWGTTIAKAGAAWSGSGTTSGGEEGESWKKRICQREWVTRGGLSGYSINRSRCGTGQIGNQLFQQNSWRPPLPALVEAVCRLPVPARHGRKPPPLAPPPYRWRGTSGRSYPPAAIFWRQGPRGLPKPTQQLRRIPSSSTRWEIQPISSLDANRFL